jgi:hypothetical protein
MGRKRTTLWVDDEGMLHIPRRGKGRDDLVLEEQPKVGVINAFVARVKAADDEAGPAVPSIPLREEALAGLELGSDEYRAALTAWEAKNEQHQAELQARQDLIVGKRPYSRAFVDVVNMLVENETDDEVVALTEDDVYPWVMYGGWNTTLFQWLVVPFDGEKPPETVMPSLAAIPRSDPG